MIGSTAVTLADATGAVWRSHGKWHCPDVKQGVGSVILTATGKPKAAEGNCHRSGPRSGFIPAKAPGG
jgi:hypothetical protein